MDYIDELRHDLEYHPHGRLIWTSCNRNSSKNGSVAGYRQKSGYRYINHKQKLRRENRLIWMFFNGSIPYGMQVDHINRIRDDNRIENLRLVSNAENQKNKSLSIRNKTGISGVSRHKKAGKWQAMISRIHLGLYDDFFEACCARKSAENKYKTGVYNG